jgi:diacylglycerol kinase family enzyme
MGAEKPILAAIVGVDGCGKSSTYRGAFDLLAHRIRVAGIGGQVLGGGPDEPLRERSDVPLSRSARIVGRLAKHRRWQPLYKNLKFVDLAEQARLRDYVAAHDSPDAILSDGDPLINSVTWSVARFYRAELAGSDEALGEVLDYAAGERSIPLRELPRYLRRSWQLVALNRLRLARFAAPDLIFLLEIDPAVALARIRARGQPLQAHETEGFLGELGRAYERVCQLLHERRGIPVVRIRVDQMAPKETAETVAATILEHVARAEGIGATDQALPDGIEVVATTMSGSIKDQRKVGQIGPEFRARTARPVRVHPAHSHVEARAIARQIVAGGGRTVVSAGGAGTFNAVLEGAHLAGAVPPDLRVAFLRKGSADLIGKALSIPDQLPEAVQAIVEGIEADRCVDADVLVVEGTALDGREARRHLVGFGGFGLFGDVPRFTETRLVKLYKGVLGTLFGDLGPFFVGLALAAIWWRLRLIAGRVSPLALTLDGEELPPQIWGAVVVLNGDLGHDFPLGRGLALGSGSFRVVAIPYRGARQALKQIVASRTGAILDRPERYGALVRTVRSLVVRPTEPRAAMVNVDGLRMMTRGEVRVSVSGRIRLVAGRLDP